MGSFPWIITIIILQRLVELVIAKRNEAWMKARGALVFGQSHYRFMVGMHIMFFVVLIMEVIFLKKSFSKAGPILLSIFLLAQAARIWVLVSLGKYWNTKIIVLPNATLIKRGPYRFIKHPNYLIVSIELLVIPLMFYAYITALIFFLLNWLMLSVRIPEEEQALSQWTNDKNLIDKKT